MNDLKRYVRQFGSAGLLRFMLYPITQLITNPFVLIVSIFGSIKSFVSNKRLQYYKHFHLASTLTYFFYASRAWNLKQFGRTGRSKFLGLGNYPLARCFNYSLFSIYSYWKYPALTVFIGMLVWLFSFLLFPNKDLYFYTCLALTSVSSLFFTNIFRCQNYNVIGWISFPIYLIGLHEGNFALASFALFLASFGSFTVVVLGNMICLIWALYYQDWIFLLAGFPAAVKILLHFYPFFKMNISQSRDILFKVSKAIGATDKVRYQRVKAKSFDLTKLYLLVLDIQFLLAIFFITDHLSILYISVIGIFILNAIKIRFADDQSMYMLKLSVAAVITMYSNNFYTLPFFWLLISPLPLLIGYFQMKVLDVLPISLPIHTEKFENQIDEFLGSVKSESRVLFAYEDPKGIYENVFSGFRNYIEAPIYRGMLKGIHLFPDWWAVFELNYEGADEIWGITSQQITENMNRWNCSYVITYTWQEKPIDELENHPKFNKISVFNWSDFDYLFKDYPKLKKDGLKWNLYEFKHKSTN